MDPTCSMYSLRCTCRRLCAALILTSASTEELLVVDETGQLTVYSVPSLTPVRARRYGDLHHCPVSALATTSVATLVADTSGNLVAFAPELDVVLADLRAHDDGVQRIVCTQDERHAISVSLDKACRVWRFVQSFVCFRLETGPGV
eukprot:m.1739 g.1739  ORF g.1739 m.1739 type:complete len:146 (-) comp2090_c0_seq2:582-1019(-)